MVKSFLGGLSGSSLIFPRSVMYAENNKHKTCDRGWVYILVPGVPVKIANEHQTNAYNNQLDVMIL